jgi:hypothetical protein
MIQEIKLSDVSLLLGMCVGLLGSALQIIPESDDKKEIKEKFDEIQQMINKIYYQDYK